MEIKTYPFILKTVITEEICKHIRSYHDYMVVWFIQKLTGNLRGV